MHFIHTTAVATASITCTNWVGMNSTPPTIYIYLGPQPARHASRLRHALRATARDGPHNIQNTLLSPRCIGRPATFAVMTMPPTPWNHLPVLTCCLAACLACRTLTKNNEHHSPPPPRGARAASPTNPVNTPPHPDFVLYIATFASCRPAKRSPTAANHLSIVFPCYIPTP